MLVQPPVTGTPYDEVLQDVTFRPLFIIGDHRSGTTLLYQLLAKTECFNVVNTYHVICYDEIVANHALGCEQAAQGALADLLAARGLLNRVIDDVQVSPDLPEEYGFVLRHVGFKPQLNDETSHLC